MSWLRQATRPLRRRLATPALRLLLFGLSLVPAGLRRPLARGLATVAWRLLKRERERTLTHLQRALPSLPEPELVGRGCFEHLAMNVLELAASPSAPGHPGVDWPATDRAIFEEALAEGRGLIFATGHIGNWELVPMAIAGAGYAPVVVAKEPRETGLRAFIDEFRQRRGAQTIWREGQGAGLRLLRALRGGAPVGLLIDQDTRVPSIPVPFFGHPALTPEAPVTLAARTGAALLFGSISRGAQGRHSLRCERVPLQRRADGEVDLLQTLTLLNAKLEQAIRRDPTQWVWMHRRWKRSPESGPESESEQIGVKSGEGYHEAPL